MSVPDQPLFASTWLAERTERAETPLIGAATEAAAHRTGGHTFVIPVTCSTLAPSWPTEIRTKRSIIGVAWNHGAPPQVR